jgi:hypothetical protein
MAPILAPILGVHFVRGHISLKNRTYCPLLDRIQPLSKTRVFLYKKRSEYCFVWAAPSLLLAPYLLYLGPFQLSVSWESNPACVKASRKFNI